MNCDDVRKLLAAGEIPSGLDWEAHRSGCAACDELVADGGELGRMLAANEAPAPDLEALLSRVTASVQRERGVRAWLRSRRTPLRVGLSLSAVASIALLVWVLGLRVDLSVYPTSRMAALLSLFGVAVVGGVMVSLRPLHRAPVPRSILTGLLAVLLLLPVAVSTLPQAHTLHPASLAGVGDDFGARAFACFLFGLELALPVLLILRLADRVQHRALGAASLAAAAAGLTGILALQIHCPITHPRHLMAGHATVVLAMVVVYVGGIRLFRRAA